MITALTGSILFSIVIALYILLASGLPYGEYAMGGKHRILPKKERIICLISVMVQIFAILILLQAGRVIRIGFSEKTTIILCYFFAVYLSLNVLMNLLSKSKKERLIMTPVSFIIAVCFWITAISI
jgi:hypothetical protein